MLLRFSLIRLAFENVQIAKIVEIIGGRYKDQKAEECFSLVSQEKPAREKSKKTYTFKTRTVPSITWRSWKFSLSQFNVYGIAMETTSGTDWFDQLQYHTAPSQPPPPVHYKKYAQQTLYHHAAQQ